MKRQFAWIITCLLLAFSFLSCTKLFKFINGTNIDKYKIEADNNSTDSDKQAINNYNYVIDLYDSLSSQSDTLRMIKFMDDIHYAKLNVHSNDNPILKQKILNNYNEINAKLDKMGIPRELKVYRKNLLNDMKHWSYSNNHIYRGEFLSNGIGVDENGAVYSYVRRDDEKTTPLEIKNDKVIEKGKILFYIDENATVKRESDNQTTKGEQVDLNEFFGNDDTDYSATELNAQEEQALKDAGIYYDDEDNCWRRRQ